MKRLLTLLALVLCSCAETFVGEEIARPNNENLPDLTASFADKEATRTYIEEGKYLRWNEDDRLTIFYGNTLNRQYKFNGATGDNSGTFSYVPSGELGTGNAFDHIYALYPYNADARITDEGVISLVLPAVQNYAENSFGRGANTMLAVTENLEDTFLAFKNACGYLKLKLYNAEGATIKSIEVKGNSGERLAGVATATIAFGEAPVLAMADDATTSVTLDCGEGVALATTAETATEFWVTLPATTFAEGLTIIATDTEGGAFEKSTTNEVIIERNAIQPMAALEAEFVAPVVKPANNEIWYTATEKADPFDDFLTFGSDVVSNVWDSETKRGIITFDGDVTTIGYSAFAYCDNLTSITIPDSVTAIGGRAFDSCSNLTSVTIPDSVTAIGYDAFRYCSSLTSVTIGDSVTMIGEDAFYYCYSLTSVTIGDSVTTIGDYAFRDCTSLTSVTIPDSVTTIGDYAFESCRSLTSITIPDSVTEIGEGAFYWCSRLTSVTIGDSVSTIGDEAFRYCSRLTSVTIGDSVSTIGDRAFYVCGSLQEFKGKFAEDNGRILAIDCMLVAFAPAGLVEYTIPDSVTAIGDNAFGECSSLTSVTIPDSVTEIGNAAFWYCNSLKSIYCKAITPPAGDFTMFDNNASGRKIYVPMESVEAYKSASYWKNYASYIVGYDFENGVAVTPKPANNEIWYTNGSTTEATTPYKANAFGANIVFNTYDDAKECWVIKFDGEVATIGDYAFYRCDILTSVTIPDSVTTIGVCAFYHCISLTSITIPDSATEIGYRTFYYCSSLTNVTIPDSVTAIGDNAFYNCESLTSVTIPDSVTTIGECAFRYCSSLTSVTIPDSVTTIGNGAFTDCSSLTSVTIGDSATAIGYAAFSSCESLTSVYCKATTPPVALLYDGCYWDAFYNNSPDRKIYVPMESVEAYKSASGWNEYADDIVGYDF